MSNFKKKVSIVIPVYNEEKNIPFLFNRLIHILNEIPSFVYEIIFVNDGSKDNSWITLKALTQSYDFVKAFNFNRNFGHQIALSAGYHYATGDAIISMDGDLQHPPEMIPAMIQSWQQGFDIVYIQNIQRNDPFLKRFTAWGFYKCLGMITDVKMPRNVADFRLIDKKVLAFINQSQEQSRYLRGMVAWSGFKHTILPCTFAKRISGTTGYTWTKMAKLALDGITGYSTHPFKFFAYSGLFILITGFMLIIHSSIHFFTHSSFSFGKLILTSIYIFIGVTMLLLWLLGEYISTLYEYTKDNALYIVSETINIK